MAKDCLSSLTWKYGCHSCDNEGHNDPRASHLLGNKPRDHIHPRPDAAAHTERHQIHRGQHPGQSGAVWAGARHGRIQHGLHGFGPQHPRREGVPCRAPLYPARVQLPHQSAHSEGVTSKSGRLMRKTARRLFFDASVQVLEIHCRQWSYSSSMWWKRIGFSAAFCGFLSSLAEGLVWFYPHDDRESYLKDKREFTFTHGFCYCVRGAYIFTTQA